MRARVNNLLDVVQEKCIGLKEKIGLATRKFRKYSIVAPDLIGDSVAIFKPVTYEKVKLMRVVGFIDKGDFSLTYPQIDLWRFNEASVIGGNDFVIKGNRVFWDKVSHYNFSKNIAADRNLIAYTQNTVTIEDDNQNINFDVAFSLLGVHASVWSHSLSEYYTKISMLPTILNIEKGTVKVLVPMYKDKQLKQVIYDALNKFERIEIVPIAEGSRVNVDRLYYLPRPTTFTDHETYVAIGDDVQPEIISSILKQNLVSEATRSAKDNAFPKKLFLIRRATHRVLTNNEEVENYFKTQGYFFLDPSKITLEEKIKYFYNAEVIIGPFSSAFSNLIFSNPGTKVLMFSNYQRIFENWLSMHYQYFNIDMWFVTGYDVSKYDSAHTNYYISLDQIKAACDKIGIKLS